MRGASALVAIVLATAGCGTSEPVDAPAGAKNAQGPIVVRRAVEAPVVALPKGDAGNDGTERWSSYRDFWFDFGSSRLDVGENSKVADVASYLCENPAYRAAIDGASDPGDGGLGERRVATIRAALIKAGVPEYKIQAGAFGDARFRRERRVEVLVLPQR